MSHLGRVKRWWHSFLFDPRKDQGQVKIRRISKLQIFLQTMTISCPVLSHGSKNGIYFNVKQLKMPQHVFKEETSSSLPISWSLQSQK